MVFFLHIIKPHRHPIFQDFICQNPLCKIIYGLCFAFLSERTSNPFFPYLDPSFFRFSGQAKESTIGGLTGRLRPLSPSSKAWVPACSSLRIAFFPSPFTRGRRWSMQRTRGDVPSFPVTVLFPLCMGLILLSNFSGGRTPSLNSSPLHVFPTGGIQRSLFETGLF